MKTQNVVKLVAVLAVVSLVGCATRRGLCPACNCKAHYEENVNQTVRQEKRSFSHTVNNKTVTDTYNVPVVDKTSTSWECSAGHTVTVVK